MLQTSFTPYVGISPGTTTMQMDGLGECVPGWYGQAIMLPGSAPAPQPIPADMPPPVQHLVAMNPYAIESKLKGLGSSTVRWDLLVLGFGAAFAGFLGWSYWKSKHR